VLGLPNFTKESKVVTPQYFRYLGVGKAPGNERFSQSREAIDTFKADGIDFLASEPLLRRRKLRSEGGIAYLRLSFEVIGAQAHVIDANEVCDIADVIDDVFD
jgi:hypothetical protein